VSATEPKIKKKRKVSYLPSIISIGMVLFMLGLFGIILINGNKLQQYLKENFQLTVFFKDEVTDADMKRVMATMQQQEYTKRVVFVSKEQAAQQFSNEIGQDFVGFLGFNPLLPSVELFLKSSFTSPDKLKTVDIELRRNPEVQEVVYQQNI
jgi:cell division transport system permease protein